MRLSEKNLRRLIDAVRAGFGDGEFYVFGSRLDDTRSGGDLDIAIPASAEGFLTKVARTRLAWERFGVPIDLDIVRFAEGMDPLLREEIENHGLRMSTRPASLDRPKRDPGER